ncbi:GTPase-activating Rap/Ran-GAP domain-like protein 3 [Entomortierella beljakovae]|nr:GTPase-activating Rap/Ran-GAP domain-like protein 3 [Entomortierella beljakovae]
MDFVHWLGDPVRLRNWKGYRAGLDIIGDTTGDKSIFTCWNGYQIMFHCAPFMPFDPKDPQQVERRRFIGNDIVVIIFKESDDDTIFDLCSVGSRQNLRSYRVTIAVKDGIRNFSPIDFPSILYRDDASRDLFLLKLICGERAAYRAKAFATQLHRTRESLLREVIERHR